MHNEQAPRNELNIGSSLPPSHNGRSERGVVLPMPPERSDLAAGRDTRFEMEVYARFMRHLREVPNSRMEIKILSAICFTADMLDAGEDMVAKTLVDLGLRAPRRAFPQVFLDFCDRCALRRAWSVENAVMALPPSVAALKDYWGGHRGDMFAPLPFHYAVFNEGLPA